MRLHVLGAVLLITALFCADLFSKQWALNTLAHQNLRLNDYCDLLLAFNHGAAFSFLANAAGWQRWFFLSISFGVSLWLSILILMTRRMTLDVWAYSCIIAGALGNAYDRAYYGYVVDFIHLHYQHWSWPVFNLADCAVSLGVALLMLDWFLAGRRKIV